MNLTGGQLSGGYRKYLARLLPLLRADPRVAGVRVYSPDDGGFRAALRDEGWYWDPRRTRWSSRRVSEVVNADRPDVVFVPTARTLAVDAPSVVMVRNMEPLVAPFAGNSALDALRNVGRRLVARRACAQADGVIAVSDFVADYLTRWGIPATKVTVVPHGVDAPMRESEMQRPATDAVDEPFLFTAGSLRPARGLEDAIEAMGALRRTGERVRLVVAGAAAGTVGRYSRRIRALLRRHDVEQTVIFAGALNDAQMAWCFRQCRLFVMTSRVEACPNTALEAMSSGSITVSTTSPPMPSFFGDTALYYPASDGNALAGQLRAGLSLSPDQRQRMAQAARERAAQFTWQRTATRTVDALLSACRRA